MGCDPRECHASTRLTLSINVRLLYTRFCATAINTVTSQVRSMWVTAFADVAEVIMGVSVEEFGAFDDAGRKKIAWGIRGMKCNMTIGKTVGEMYTNYTVKSLEFAGYLP